MKVCIYCEVNETEGSFNGKEHVIPRLMGVFQDNLTLKDVVCDNCNSVIFSSLETEFKEDTEEGIWLQMFNFEDNTQIRIRSKNATAEFSAGLGDDFFNAMFPFLEVDKKGNILFLFRPQIKIKKGEGSFLILLTDKLKEVRGGSKRFRSIQRYLQGVTNEDISIFGGIYERGEDPLEEPVELLKSYGIDYKSKKEKKVKINPEEPVKAGFTLSAKFTEESAKVLAKIAFNYFSFCALKTGNRDLLFHPNFRRLKYFILGELELPLEEVIIKIEGEERSNFFDEMEKRVRFLGHTITFSLGGDNVVATVSIMGRKTYHILLGPAPKELLRADFGSGCFFDINAKTYHLLTQDEAKRGSDINPGFGLFNRI